MPPIFALSLWSSLPIFLLIAFRKLLGRKIPRSWILCAWLAIAIRLLLPVPVLTHIFPDHSARIFPTDPVIVPQLTQDVEAVKIAVNGLHSYSSLFVATWAFGMLILLFHYGMKLIRTFRKVEALKGCAQQKELLYFNKPLFCKFSKESCVEIYHSQYIQTALSFFFLKPVIFLPLKDERRVEKDQFIFLHEMSHIRHRDTWWILLAALLRSIHWFNPLIWLGSYFALCDLELRCDEEVLSSCGNNRASAYANSLVEAASENKPQSMFACSAYISRALKERIISIIKTTKMSGKVKIICGVLLAVLLSGTCIAVESFGLRQDSMAAASQQVPEIWKVNANGETYGSLNPEGKTTEEIYPDLIGAVGENDVFGYIRLKERLLLPPIQNKSPSDEPRPWPLYAEDGVTVIGQFNPVKANVTYDE